MNLFDPKYSEVSYACYRQKFCLKQILQALLHRRPNLEQALLCRRLSLEQALLYRRLSLELTLLYRG